MCEHTVEKRLNNLNEVQVKEDILFDFFSKSTVNDTATVYKTSI